MSEAVAAALEAAQEAKHAYRGVGGAEQRAAHRQASTELRYQRWIDRAGPAQEQARLAAVEGHSNNEVATFYQRWLDENPEA